MVGSGLAADTSDVNTTSASPAWSSASFMKMTGEISTADCSSAANVTTMATVATPMQNARRSL